MLRRDLLKSIAGLPFCGLLKNKESYAAYTIPHYGKIPEKIVIGKPILRYGAFPGFLNEKTIKIGDELFWDDEGRLTNDIKFKRNNSGYRFFAMSANIVDNECIVYLNDGV